MKTMYRLAAATAALCMLSGCGNSAMVTLLSRVAEAIPKATEQPATTERPAAEQPATEQPAATEAPVLVSGGDTVLPFTDIRPIYNINYKPAQDYHGCYTFCMEDKWGIMAADGTVIVPAFNELPVIYVRDGFSANSSDVGVDNWTTIDNKLAAAGYPRAQDASDSRSTYFCIKPGGDFIPKLSVFSGDDFEPVGADEYTRSGAWLPCRPCTSEWEENYEMYYAIPCGDYTFCSADGRTLAEGATFSDTGWFYNETMAPVKQGAKWAYLGSDGKLLTDYLYDSYIYNANDGTGTMAATEGAANASGGYAAVTRDGKWGILSADGTEIVPCTYDGAVNYLGNIWLKEADGWHPYSLPGAPAVAIAATPAEGTTTMEVAANTASDRYIVTAQSGLILRQGPGTNFEKLTTIPQGTIIECLVVPSDPAGWISVSYNGQNGYVNTEYLAKLS